MFASLTRCYGWDRFERMPRPNINFVSHPAGRVGDGLSGKATFGALRTHASSPTFLCSSPGEGCPFATGEWAVGWSLLVAPALEHLQRSSCPSNLCINYWKHHLHIWAIGEPVEEFNRRVPFCNYLRFCLFIFFYKVAFSRFNFRALNHFLVILHFPRFFWYRSYPMKRL